MRADRQRIAWFECYVDSSCNTLQMFMFPMDVTADELLAGTLYIIPQPNGKVLWRAKRALGQGF